MKFLHKNSIQKQISDDIILNEYCTNHINLPIDGAYAIINGALGPKINKSFTELFFVISGKLQIEQNNVIYELNEKDMFIVQPNVKHKINGFSCEVFISCAPQFNPDSIEFIDE